MRTILKKQWYYRCMTTVYTSPGCGYCHMVMEYLKGKNIAFTERNIANDKEALDFVANTVGQLATPVTDVDGTIILGYDREAIDAALKAKNLV